MKINQLRDVLAVAERGSLRAAARHLEVAQPAISRSIRELERELGVDLFERTSQGAVVTEIGRRFILRALAAQNELDRAVDEVNQLRGQIHGSVSVCLSTAAHIALLPDALEPFRKRYRRVQLNLREGLFSDVEIALINGTLDFYAGPLPEQQLGGNLHVETLFENERVIVARKNHRLRRAKTLSDLIDAEWITTSTTVKAENELGPLFRRHQLPAPKIAVQTHSGLSMITVVAFSDLLAMLPIQWISSPWASSMLQQVNIGERIEAPPICIVRRSNLPLTPAAEYLCDLLRRASIHANSGPA